MLSPPASPPGGHCPTGEAAAAPRRRPLSRQGHSRPPMQAADKRPGGQRAAAQGTSALRVAFVQAKGRLTGGREDLEGERSRRETGSASSPRRATLKGCLHTIAAALLRAAAGGVGLDLRALIVGDVDAGPANLAARKLEERGARDGVPLLRLLVGIDR